MSIKNRLSKLEKSSNGGEFCNCENVPKTEVYLSGLEAGDDEPRLSGDAVPDICRLCRKPISKLAIVVNFTDEPIQGAKPRLPNTEELRGQLCS